MSMQQVSLCLEDLFTLHLGLILLPQFPGGLENLLLSTHLRIFDFRFRITVLPVTQFPGAWPILFLSSSFPGLTRDPKLDEEVSSLHWLCITRFTSLAFAVGEPSFEVVSCPPFDMAPITMFSLIRMSASTFLVFTYLIRILGSVI